MDPEEVGEGSEGEGLEVEMHWVLSRVGKGFSSFPAPRHKEVWAELQDEDPCQRTQLMRSGN